MKFYIFISLIIILCFKSANEEGGLFDSLLQGLTSLKNISDTKKEEKEILKSEIINATEENIYEMNSTEQFDLNIKVNGTKGENALIILFYSESCGHCIRFLPVYREISETLKNDTTLKFSKIQTTYCQDIFKKYPQIKVPGIPTLFLYQKGRFTRQEGSRTKEKIISFIYQTKDFDCNEITSLEQLSLYINPKIIFSQDTEKHFVLGIFKINEYFNKRYIVDNFVDLISLSSDIVLNKKCYYFFKNESLNINDIEKSNIYLRYALDNKNNEINDYLIYSYNYQKGFNTFSLFGAYLLLQTNLTKIDKDFKNTNINNAKNSKIIKNKFNSFLDENYLPKYFDINDSKDIYSSFNGYERKMFLFYYNNSDLKKFYIDEINYIFSLNHSINANYLFILFNTTNNKVNKKARLSFFNLEDYENIVLLKEGEVNKTSVESKILEYIDKDRKNEIKSNSLQGLIKSFLGWIANIDEKDKINKVKDNEKELIDEINKTIIEDEKAQKIKQEKQKNESSNQERKNSENEENKNNIEKRRKILESYNNEELGFNKKLLVFPIFLIIYSFLFFLFNKYILSKYDYKILYTRLPSEDPKDPKNK